MKVKEGIEVAVSTPALAVPTLEDEPLSTSPDLTSNPIRSLHKSPCIDLNQVRDLYSRGRISPNTNRRLLSPTMKFLISGYGSLEQYKSALNGSLEESISAPKRAKRTAMEGEVCLILE